MKNKSTLTIVIALVIFLFCCIVTSVIGGSAYLNISSPTVADLLEKGSKEENFKETIKIISENGENSFESTIEFQYVSPDKFYAIGKADFDTPDTANSSPQSYERLKNGEKYYQRTNSTDSQPSDFYNVWSEYSSQESDSFDLGLVSLRKAEEMLKDTNIDLNQKIRFGTGTVVLKPENAQEFILQFNKNVFGIESDNQDLLDTNQEKSDVEVTIEAQRGKIKMINVKIEGMDNGEKIILEFEFKVEKYGGQNIDQKLEEVKDAKPFELDFGG